MLDLLLRRVSRVGFIRDLVLIALLLFLILVVMPEVAGTRAPLAVVSSWSMEPALHIGDLIVVSGRERPKVGDVIVYSKPTGELIVHRVIRIERTARGLVYITKGDANPAPDPPVDEGRVVGKVVFTVPYLGWLRLLFERVLWP